MQGLTREQLMQMGAKPITTQSSGGGLTREQLMQMGGKPVSQSQQVESQKQQRISQGLPVSVRQDRAEPTFGGSVVRELTKIPLKAALSVARPAVNIEEGITVKSPYLGDVSDIGKTIDQGADRIADKYKQGDITLGGALLRAGPGQALKETSDLASLIPFGTAASATKTAVTKGVVPKLLSSPTLQSFSRGFGLGAGQNLGQQLSSGEQVNAGEVVTSGLLGGALDTGANVGLPKLVGGIKNTIGRVAIGKPIQELQSDIVKQYEKGVKPLINTKMTPNKLTKYREDVVNAVQTIKENKDKLQFTDDVGDVITGETPKTLQQLADSVEQTKKSVFSTYDKLAQDAGEAGVAIDMKPISSELDSVINSKSLAITNPKAIKYAQDLKKRLNNVGKLDASTAQEVIQNYNKSLEAFYRNPNYDNASQAAIDAMIANNMRKSLDDGITGLTGTQYQQLKNQYGALKTIEKDVIKASLRDARKNVKGLIDFTDIFSGGQIVNGILSLNPAQIGSGLAQKGIASFYKYLNDPNRAIQKMFSSLDKIPQPLRPSKNFQANMAIKPSTNPANTGISSTLPQKPKKLSTGKKKVK